MKKLASKRDVGDPTAVGVTGGDGNLDARRGSFSIEVFDEVDDETIAACVAAISMLLARRSASDRQQAAVGKDASAWREASLLEGTGVSRKIGSMSELACTRRQVEQRKRSIWHSAGLPFLSCLLTVLVGATLACTSSFSPAFATAVEEPLPVPDKTNAGVASERARALTVNRASAESDRSNDSESDRSSDRSSAATNDRFDNRTGSPRLRIALSAQPGATWSVEAVDGANIVDSLGNVVATLPPQSIWSTTVNQSAITFGGKNDQSRLANSAGRKNYRSVAFVPHAASPSGITGSADRSFRLPLNAEAGFVLVPNPRGDRESQVFGFNGKLYRGSLWLGNVRPIQPPSDKKAPEPSVPPPVPRAINIVDVEDYLLSVVPSEMPASWPLEALKAQAVSARSYALSNLGKHASEGYDLKDTIEDQVYTGIGAENDATNEAVASTDGIVLKHNGRICTAFFHSASGGSTEVADVVWGRSVPYLKAVPDYDDESPHSSWTRRFSVEAVEKALKLDSLANDIGALLSITLLRNSQSQRVQEVLLTGSSGTRITSGERLRRLFKLPSTIFNVGCEPGNYVIAGRGFGHGLGLSQWGAKSLAQQGYNAAQILAYYYKDVSVEYVTDTPGI